MSHVDEEKMALLKGRVTALGGRVERLSRVLLGVLHAVESKQFLKGVRKVRAVALAAETRQKLAAIGEGPYARRGDEMTIRLVDGVRQNRKHPETFWIPSRSEKLKVIAGDYVKVGFIPSGGTTETMAGERMWVLVTRTEERKYFGVLHNEPLSFFKKDLKYGDAVEFEARHMLDIINTGRA